MLAMFVIQQRKAILSETYPFLAFVDHTDPILVNFQRAQGGCLDSTMLRHLTGKKHTR